MRREKRTHAQRKKGCGSKFATRLSFEEDGAESESERERRKRTGERNLTELIKHRIVLSSILHAVCHDLVRQERAAKDIFGSPTNKFTCLQEKARNSMNYARPDRQTRTLTRGKREQTMRANTNTPPRYKAAPLRPYTGASTQPGPDTLPS